MVLLKWVYQPAPRVPNGCRLNRTERNESPWRIKSTVACTNARARDEDSAAHECSFSGYN
jgi:hypothetical protein